MRMILSLTATLVLFVVLDSVSVAQAQETSLSAQTILAHMDSVLNAPKDQIYGMELVLIEEDGTERGRMLKMWQKGSEMRLVKFLEPAEVRNVGFLSLPDDVMYIYLPAFKRVRRIAAHVKTRDSPVLISVTTIWGRSSTPRITRRVSKRRPERVMCCY